MQQLHAHLLHLSKGRGGALEGRGIVRQRPLYERACRLRLLSKSDQRHQPELVSQDNVIYSTFYAILGMGFICVPR